MTAELRTTLWTMIQGEPARENMTRPTTFGGSTPKRRNAAGRTKERCAIHVDATIGRSIDEILRVEGIEILKIANSVYMPSVTRLNQWVSKLIRWSPEIEPGTSPQQRTASQAIDKLRTATS